MGTFILLCMYCDSYLYALFACIFRYHIFKDKTLLHRSHYGRPYLVHYDLYLYKKNCEHRECED